MRLAFSACCHLSFHYSSIFFCFHYTCICGPGMFRQIFSLFLSVSWKPHHFALIVYSFQGIKQKKLKEVMAAYLLYRCKHLCMLIFRFYCITYSNCWAALKRCFPSLQRSTKTWRQKSSLMAPCLKLFQVVEKSNRSALAPTLFGILYFFQLFLHMLSQRRIESCSPLVES